MTGRRGDHGSVTVELALVLPAVVAVLALVLGAVRVAAEVARRVAGADVAVEVARDPGWVTVTVSDAARWPWPARAASVALPDQP